MSNNLLGRLIKSSSVQSSHLVLTIIQQILLVPFFINYWGADEYGKYLACLSGYSLLISLDNGFGTYVTNEYNLKYFKDKNDSKYFLASSLKTIFISNCLQMLIVLLILLVKNLYNYDVESNEIFYGIIFLSAHRILCGGFKGIMSRSLYPIGLFHKSSMIDLGEAIFDLFIVAITVYIGFDFLNVILTIAITRSIYTFFSFYLIFKWSGISIVALRKKGSLKLGLNSYKKSIPLMLNSFMDKGSNDGLKTIVALTLGASTLPIFTTVKTMASMVNRLVSLIIQPLTPELGRFHSLGEKTKITDIFRLSWIMTSILVAIPIIIFSFFSADIYEFWLDDRLEFMPTLYATLIIGSLIYSYGRSYISYMTSINYVKGLTIISFLRGLGILGLSFLFIHLFGLSGLGWSSLIIEFIVSIFIPYILVYKIWDSDKSFIPKKEMLINLVVVLLVCTCIFFTVFSIFWQTVLLFVILIIGLSIYQVRKISNYARKKLFLNV